MSVDSTTRRQPPPPPPPPSRSGLNPLTLAIAAMASVIAAVVVSHFWAGGTLWATAMTPVIVAVVKEALERPAQRITEVSVAPLRRHPDDLVVEEVEPGPDPYAAPEPAGYRTYGVRRKHFKLAIVTGLIAFVIGAAVLTIPELVAGRSITSGDRHYTVLGGKSTAKKRQQRQTTETTTVTTTTTVPQDTTTTPTEQQTTPTTPQDTTTTPPPSQTAPTPQDTTPAPPAGSPPPPAQTQPQP